MRLIDIRKIEGKIILRTGLHIGGGDMEMRIGGTDNQVIKHPYTNEPYIPGSSLKGKVRCLLEMRTGIFDEEGKPFSYATLQKDAPDDRKDDCRRILKLFGTSGADTDKASELGSTRVSFMDCRLNKEWKTQADEKNWPFIEVKSENSIKRTTGTAENPRFSERVPAGAVFDFVITIKEMEEDKDENLLDLLLEGLRLLELDALGGSGSRGYGRISFEFNDEGIKERFEGIRCFEKEG